MLLISVKWKKTRLSSHVLIYYFLENYERNFVSKIVLNFCEIFEITTLWEQIYWIGVIWFQLVRKEGCVLRLFGGKNLLTFSWFSEHLPYI